MVFENEIVELTIEFYIKHIDNYPIDEMFDRIKESYERINKEILEASLKDSTTYKNAKSKYAKSKELLKELFNRFVELEKVY